MGDAPRDLSESAAARPATWIPALVGLVLFSQVCLLGLRPALAESRRLQAAEGRMEARHSAALNQQVELDRVLRAQRDPIYLERERRHLLVPQRTANER